MQKTQPVKAGIFYAMLREKRGLVLTIALIIVSLVITGFVWAQKKVSVIADGKTINVRTLHTDPIDILAQAGIYLASKDEFRLSTAQLTNGTVIEVFRAVPVIVTYQGQSEVKITGKPTVAELVASMGIPVSGKKLLPEGTARLTPGMKIQVITVREQPLEQTMSIPYPVVRQADPTLEKGAEAVRQAGQEGLKKVTVKLRYEDEQQVSADVIAEQIVKPPVPKLISVGVRDTIETSRGTLRFQRMEWMEATAYNPTDGSPHGLTATGIPARRGIVAVDPDVIPLGTKVYVPGYGLALAADVGGDINGNRIDLCMEGYDEAWNFGRRMVKVYILGE